ncbi:enoyl-CoA hydratase-related protein [Oceanospirillum linum]|uniref:enoyl-CoA hydratase-related protein n=1 Tax=Oceanospirillum linum TaxID=966 RepID=UPI002367C76D|nr:enoyl-CoA hydratase-related protein [Oceanospirillum linum]
MAKIQSIPQPVIAKVHGIATAAGCQLVATCDLAYAAADSRFATPGVNIGLFCSTPMVALTRAVHPKQAMAMLLTGEMVTADKAEQVGLINEAVAPDALDARVDEVAQLIAAKSSYTLKVGKEAFYQQRDMTQSDAYHYCSRVMTENMLAHDAQEGVDAFLGKRPACWQGR